MRRAAVSVPSNIAEGYGRKTTQEYMQALYIANGSNCELETQILLSGDLKNLQRDMGDIERMFKALITSLGTKPLNPWTLFSNFFGEEPNSISYLLF